MTFSIVVKIRELLWELEGVLGNMLYPFELSTICRETSVLIQSWIWIKATSTSVHFCDVLRRVP